MSISDIPTRSGSPANRTPRGQSTSNPTTWIRLAILQRFLTNSTRHFLRRLNKMRLLFPVAVPSII